MRQKMPIDLLVTWFRREKRSFPWRESPSPYAVWVSEVMLQQTRAEVVVAYFQQWMARFPTIEALASASLDEVIKAWEGLGYYSRARNLHRAARELVQRHGGKLPREREELEKIAGLGPYTAGAILSFAFHLRSAAVDGNVMRVMARYFAVEEEISKSSVQKRIRTWVDELLPEKEPWVAMEALIELGAQVCQRTPRCERCPLRGGCLGHQSGRAAQLPRKPAPPPITLLTRSVTVVCCREHLLLKRGKEGRVMADLFEFPYFEGKSAVGEKVAEHVGMRVQLMRLLAPVSHAFTRFKAELFPSLWSVPEKREIADHLWIEWREAAKLPFSAGHRKVFRALQSEDFTH